jgi:hypothetical protein
VQTVKSRIKQEQLTKFRETLQGQASMQALIEPKPTPSQLRRPPRSNSKSHIKSNSSLEFSKTGHFRPNKSQDHFAQPKLTSSFKHFQDLLKYKCNQEVIEERESENVTSARLGRQEEHNPPRPLQEIRYNSNQHAFGQTAHHKFLQMEESKAIQEDDDGPW